MLLEIGHGRLDRGQLCIEDPLVSAQLRQQAGRFRHGECEVYSRAAVCVAIYDGVIGQFAIQDLFEVILGNGTSKTECFGALPAPFAELRRAIADIVVVLGEVVCGAAC